MPILLLIQQTGVLFPKDSAEVSGPDIVNAGANLGAGFDPIDASGKNRNEYGTWDIGAYEFTGPTPPDPTKHHVNAGATCGTTCDGSNWNKAWKDLAAAGNLERGHTYYIADGTYPGYTFDDPAIGTQWITIKKAIPSDHGTNDGWPTDNSFGDGQAVFGPMTHNVEGGGGYIKFDGRSPHVPYGFKFDFDEHQAGFNYLRGGPHIEFYYVDFDGLPNSSGDHWYVDPPWTYAIKVLPWGWTGSEYGYDDTSGMVVSHCALHGSGTIIQDSSSNNYPRVEYNDIYDARGITINNVGDHANIYFSNSDHGIFRFNYIHNYNVEGLYFTYGQEDWQVYGNVFVGVGINARGIEFFEKNQNGTGRNDNIKVYNNTFINLPSGAVRVMATTVNTNSEFKNNLMYNAPIGIENDGDVVFANNYQAVPDDFVNFSGGNYRLSKPTLAGTTLLPPYNIDPDNVTRGSDGVWDVGAYEYGGVHVRRDGACSSPLVLNTCSSPGTPTNVSETATHYIWTCNGNGIDGATNATCQLAKESTPPTVSTPGISPNGGTFGNSVMVSLSAPGAEIHYTTNGKRALPKLNSLYRAFFTDTNNNSESAGL